jgi:hypothetical protein
MTVHTRLEIERQLRQRKVPCTQNREALVELGFMPAYPHLLHDVYYGALWTRVVDAHNDPAAPPRPNAKMLVVERAVHIGAEHRAHRIRLRRAGRCSAVTTRRRAYFPLRARRVVGVVVVRERESNGDPHANIEPGPALPWTPHKHREGRACTSR